MFAYSPWACNRRGEGGGGIPEWEAFLKEDRVTEFLEELGSLGNPAHVTRGHSIPCWLGDWCWGGGIKEVRMHSQENLQAT